MTHCCPICGRGYCEHTPKPAGAIQNPSPGTDKQDTGNAPPPREYSIAGRRVINSRCRPFHETIEQVAALVAVVREGGVDQRRMNAFRIAEEIAERHALPDERGKWLALAALSIIRFEDAR